MKSFRAVWLLIPVLNTLQQIFLKESAEALAGGVYGWLEQLAVSPWFGLAIVAEVVCFAIWMTVLSELDLSIAFPLSAVSYVLVIAIAWLGYGEPARLTDIAGSALILLGVWYLGSSEMPSHTGADEAGATPGRDIRT